MATNRTMSIMPGLDQSLRSNQRLRQKLVQTPSMQLAMRIMATRLSHLRFYVRDVAEDNPYLDAVLPDVPIASAGVGIDLDGFASDAVRDVSLYTHIDSQINQIISAPDDRYLARQLVRYISPAGWLSEDAEDDMTNAGFHPEDVGRVISLMQGMEPAGMFARNLQECISLQLHDRGEADGDTELVLTHLDSMLDGGIAAATGLHADALAAALDKIRRCTPKPGAMFQYDEGDIFTPDLIMTGEGDGAINVAVNDDGMPSLDVKAGPVPDDEAGKMLLAAAEREASAIKRAIKNRSEMLLAAGGILAQVQANFLVKGEAYIAPFSMVQLAEMMGCHKSTISRLMADKLVQTPLGMMAMSDLCARGVKQADGSIRAGRAIKAQIISVISRGGQWSDQALVDQLKADGITIARRTVNKYRNAQLMG